MKAFSTRSLLALTLLTLGCGGRAAVENETGRGGMSAGAGMVGTTASGGTANGMGGLTGLGATAAECTTDEDCGKSMSTCVTCADGSLSCPWVRCANGECSAGFPACPDPGAACAGKSCGDACSTCTGETCPSVQMYCDQNLTCQPLVPVCDGGACKSDDDCPNDFCATCPNSGSTQCVPQACIDGQCTTACSGTSPCGTCAAGTTCAWGGNVGDHFQCLPLKGCNVGADPCTCITGGGACSDASGSTAYCKCFMKSK